MILTIPQTVLNDSTQELDFSVNNICTLIGKNGSGKSSILEAIFKKYSLSDELRVISFSSGQNERFSKIYNDQKSTKFKKITQIDNDTLEYVNIFHFDKTWVKILVFLATSLFDKKTRNYLKEKYINFDDNDDLSSTLKVKLHIPKFYIDQIQDAYKKEETEPMHKSVRRTYLHAMLTRILEKSGYENYDFEKELKIDLSINAKETYGYFESDIDKIFTFLSLTNHGATSMFDIKNAFLVFNNDIEFDSLSDGEYQLLSIYALVDLFDTNNTLFLFDEIDSHLHYKNINILWNVINELQAKLVTTSHMTESIINNKFESIKYIENGSIDYSLTAKKIIEKISNVVNQEKFIYQISSTLDNIALVDDESDWEIFKELAKIKIGEEVIEVLNKVTPLKEGSGWNYESQLFGSNKIEFVKKIKEYSRSQDINLKNIFMICDNDEYGLSSVKTNMECRKTPTLKSHMEEIENFNSSHTKSYLLSWRRREILHYMISYSMLKEYEKLDELRFIADYIVADSSINKNFDNDTNVKTTPKSNVKFIKLLMCREDGNIDDDNWTDYNKIKEIIAKIPSAEISDDIVKMYQFIKNKVES